MIIQKKIQEKFDFRKYCEDHNVSPLEVKRYLRFIGFKEGKWIDATWDSHWYSILSEKRTVSENDAKEIVNAVLSMNKIKP